MSSRTPMGLQICASLNHRKKIEADPSADSSKAFSVNREVSMMLNLSFRTDAGCLMRMAGRVV